MVAYMDLVKELILAFERIEVEHILREHNLHGDALSNLGSAVKTSSAPAPHSTVACSVETRYLVGKQG